MGSSSSSASPEHGWCRACGAEVFLVQGRMPDHPRPGSGIPCVNDCVLVPVSPGEASNSTDQEVRDLWGYGPLPDWMAIAQQNRQIAVSMGTPPPLLSIGGGVTHWPGGNGGSSSFGLWQAGGGGGFSGEFAQARDLRRAVEVIIAQAPRPASPSHGPLEAVPETPQVPDEPYVEHRANFIDTGDREELRLMEQALADAWPRDPRPREEIEHEALETSVPARIAVAPPEPRHSHRRLDLILLALVIAVAVITFLAWPPS